jgi:hypothetical protein
MMLQGSLQQQQQRQQQQGKIQVVVVMPAPQLVQQRSLQQLQYLT